MSVAVVDMSHVVNASATNLGLIKLSQSISMFDITSPNVTFPDGVTYPMVLDSLSKMNSNLITTYEFFMLGHEYQLVCRDYYNHDTSAIIVCLVSALLTVMIATFVGALMLQLRSSEQTKRKLAVALKEKFVESQRAESERARAEEERNRAEDERARAEEERARAENEKKKAEEALKTRSLFLSKMSHELRTPLNGVIGGIQLMLGM